MPASEPPVRACPPAAAEGGRVLLERRFERTLSLWLERFSAPRWRGCHLEGWLFEGPAERRAAEQQFAALGVHARLHSAYKPLLHHVVDAGVQPGELVAARVLYPIPDSGPARRFALEAYPLGALLPAGPWSCCRAPTARPATPWSSNGATGSAPSRRWRPRIAGTSTPSASRRCRPQAGCAWARPRDEAT